jgi:hypothetical protein
MRTLVDRAAAGVILGSCFAIAGCSSTTAIRPDQLPILTHAAALNTETWEEVIDASGQRVRVNGTLDVVKITAGPEGLAKTFQAPMAVELDGATLSVADEKKAATFPLASIQDVKVTYADKDSMLVGGMVLDVIGGLFLAGGTATVIGGIVIDTGRRSEFPVGAIIILIVGLPLLTVGPAFLAPGIVLTKSGARLPKYPPRPPPRVEAGLGRVRVSF